ncbi:hypothetical protein evm_007128 [Chilo suppressalis]|nr:hypothetical protein evm_007128 [Chilo suppressalis]
MFVALWLESIKMAQDALSAMNGSLEDVVGSFGMVPCIGYLPLGLTKTYMMKRDPLVFENMVKKLRNMFPKGIVTEEEHKIVKPALTRLNYVNKGYYWYNNMSLVIFLFDTYINGVHWAIGHDVPAVLPFGYWLPFDPAQSVPAFMILLNLQVWHAILAIWFSMCGDLLMFTFLTHISLQFDLLAVRIRRLIYVPVDKQLLAEYPLGLYDAEHLNDSKTTEDMRNGSYLKEVKDIIKNHYDLMRLAADVEGIYSFPMVIHFFNSSIIICFCTFCGALVENWNEMRYKCFLFVALFESLLLCWFGHRLIESSQDISQAVYNSGWYKASSKIKSSLLVILIRAQRPLHITTFGYSVISLKTFTTLIKTAWSYFTLLLNLYKKP